MPPRAARHQDWKTILIEHAQAQGLGEVSYEVEGEGPDHQRVFTAHAFVSERPDPIGAGQASSKKHAENAAAQDAMEPPVSREVVSTRGRLPSRRLESTRE